MLDIIDLTNYWKQHSGFRYLHLILSLWESTQTLDQFLILKEKLAKGRACSYCCNYSVNTVERDCISARTHYLRDKELCILASYFSHVAIYALIWNLNSYKKYRNRKNLTSFYYHNITLPKNQYLVSYIVESYSTQKREEFYTWKKHKKTALYVRIYT